MSDSFQIMLAKLRIGQMNDPISLIMNTPNRATKGPVQLLGEILALREDLVSMVRKWDAVKGVLDLITAGGEKARAAELEVFRLGRSARTGCCLDTSR